jgi:radical SAM protein with 4Fe4S-binding SPASM domain
MDCVSIIDQPNKTFCMAPWIHLHSWANGTVYPCCVSNSSPEHAYGNLRTNSLKDLYNSEKIKQLRRNMMNDVATDTCQKCYDQETIGIRSVRQNMNIDYLNNYRHLVELTDEYGFVTPDNIQLPYLDLRFSNICNLKCRTCSLDFSSKWYEDELKLQGRDISDTRIIKIRENTESIFSELDPLIPNIKKIYFAGGEPLIMQEHWTFLEKIQQQNCNHIELFYQTNLTQLKYKNKNIFDIWNHFDSVNVSASLDASHSFS